MKIQHLVATLGLSLLSVSCGGAITAPEETAGSEVANFGGSTERIRVYQRYHEGNKDFLVSSDYREGYQFGYLPNRTGKGFSVFTVFNPKKVSAEKKSALIRCNKNGKHYADVGVPRTRRLRPESEGVEVML